MQQERTMKPCNAASTHHETKRLLLRKQLNDDLLFLVESVVLYSSRDAQEETIIR